MRSDGFEFGNYILGVINDQLNADNKGYCSVGKSNFYDIEGDS